MPEVGTNQNGSGEPCTIVTDYNSYGQVADVIDADGYETSYGYDPLSGVLTQTVTVVSITPYAAITTSSQVNLLGRTIRTQDGNQTASDIATNCTTIKYDDHL